MNCDEVRDRIDAALAGRLAPSELTKLEAHIAGCAECRTDFGAARALAAPVARLPRAIEPPPAVWAGIEARIRPARRRAFPAVAAALLLMAASSAATVLIMRQDPAEAAAALPAFESDYIEQAAALSRVLGEERGALAPETIETLERNLRIIDQAIAESRAALEADPGDPDLRLLLRASHEQKVALLEQAARLAREL
ncbi:MAG TPA: zf-HC2 domain-containing protein [Gemmatimonadales bacterium]|nr:zf-HC2 domain-containing protein [Gemmatimonadales bacterium]